ncbi:hypothetical protein A3H87_04840 [Candidatus Curtissbacteria bacterium RIFCSPLOWO2_02_FULL_42_37]|nr:MAG: hypothetical protein A3E71_01650 [Candidatus Curtissbacteria bacterium RIFCSPHIGHO2_12_FULL_42_33]OGE03246.1 MAG: hypothetical protein A3G16_01705 [Candidatus Curtissbacteria bacterium RIFCSPLOWO2_12_FULL_41_16]OGE11658.1 MAG: hypothetical protein A3H87_04840 [Candidatus Curtissbacteria bacterium RIFCSPLOWO2_02_FULL_42_37]
MDQSSTESKEHELIVVNRINFLIHPGFIGEEAESLFSDQVRIEDIREESAELLLRYRHIIDRVADSHNELLLLIPYDLKKDFRKAIKEKRHWLELARYAKQRLGARFMVIPDDLRISFEWTNEDIKTQELKEYIKSKLTKRGLLVSEDAESFCYGETSGVCVTDAAINLNGIFDLKKPTRIILGLTEGYKDLEKTRRIIQSVVISNKNEDDARRIIIIDH